MSQNPGPQDPTDPGPEQTPPQRAANPGPPPESYGQPEPPAPQQSGGDRPGDEPSRHPGPAPYYQPDPPPAQQAAPNAPPPPGYVPPQPGYAPPPGYGPPPPGYAQPPPGYAQPQGPQPGAALSWAWSKFTSSAGAWIGGMIVWGVLLVLAVGLPLIPLSFSAAALTEAATFGVAVPAGAVVGLLLSILAMVLLLLIVTALLYAALLSAARKAADGGRVGFGDVMRPRRFGSFLLTFILLGLIGSVASIIPVIGTLAAQYLFWLAPNAVVQEDEDGPVSGLGRSWNLTTKNFSDAVVGFLIYYGLNLAGGLIIIGLIVTMPVTVLLATYYYRALHGRTVAPAA